MDYHAVARYGLEAFGHESRGHLPPLASEGRPFTSKCRRHEGRLKASAASACCPHETEASGGPVDPDRGVRGESVTLPILIRPAEDEGHVAGLIREIWTGPGDSETSRRMVPHPKHYRASRSGIMLRPGCPTETNPEGVQSMTLPASKTLTMSGILLLGGLAGLVPFARGEAGAATSHVVPSGNGTSYAVEFAVPEVAQATSPRFVYSSGFQGVGYHANRGTRPAASGGSRGQSVGPGVRDWSTGRGGRLHKPWLQPR